MSAGSSNDCVCFGQVPKKTTIGKYLELVKQQLVSEFAELRGVGAENLIYIKEDLIIPHVSDVENAGSKCLLILLCWMPAALLVLRLDCDESARKERAALLLRRAR